MHQELPVGEIRRTSAVEAVRLRAATAIALGLLRPGDRLPPPESGAPAFGVSAMSVTRAYRELERDGLVRRVRGRAGGTFVAEAPPAAALDPLRPPAPVHGRVLALIDQRIAVEIGLAAAFAGRPDRGALVGPLSALVDAMLGAEDWAAFRAADTAFHAGIAAAAQLPAAAELHARICAELEAQYLPYDVTYLRQSNDQHRHILAAIADGDVARTCHLLHEHIAELRGTSFLSR